VAISPTWRRRRLNEYRQAKKRGAARQSARRPAIMAGISIAARQARQTWRRKAAAMAAAEIDAASALVAF